ncbi:MAG: hypothetical protein ACYDCW_01835 [Acidithiobacillus ferrivorans]
MGTMRYSYVITFVGDMDNQIEILPSPRFSTMQHALEKVAELEIHARTLRMLDPNYSVGKLQIVEIPETQKEAS